MELTEEHFEKLLEDFAGATAETAVFNATQRPGVIVRMVRPRRESLIEFVRKLLAAHNAGAQGEPVAAQMVYFKRTSSAAEDCIPVLPGRATHHVNEKLITRIVDLCVAQPQPTPCKHDWKISETHRDGNAPWVCSKCGVFESNAHPQPMTDAARDAAWLIEWPAEESMPARWWNPLPNMGWVTDATRAVRFARKDDAEAYIHCGRHQFVAGVIATEHIFDAEIERLDRVNGDNHE